MGFINKLWNLVRGKGFKEEEKIEEKITDIEKELRNAEDIIEPKKKVIVKKEEKKIEIEKPKGIEKIERRYKRKETLTTVQNKLRKGITGETAFTPTNDMGQLRGVYNKLLKKSTISTQDKYGNEDEALIEVLIENRRKLQHRFTAEILIKTTKGEGRMSIDGILAEDISGIYNYIQIGGTYTSQEIKIAMNNAMAYFEKQYGSIGGSIQAPLETTSVITDIEVKMTFA